MSVWNESIWPKSAEFRLIHLQKAAQRFFFEGTANVRDLQRAYLETLNPDERHAAVIAELPRGVRKARKVRR